MLRVEQIRDVGQLRQVAVLLERENDRLHARIQELTRELVKARGGDAAAALQQELSLLKELLQRREHALFGDSSERRPALVEEDAAPARPRRGHGPTPQPQLPIVEVYHELPPDQRDCPACGGQLDEMTGQHEESEEITVVERRFELRKQLRKKYRCRCNGAVVTAPGPLKLKPGCRYSVEFAVEVAAGKYLEHLPLERQSQIMMRQGLQVTTQTLWDQINTLAGVLEPTWRRTGEEVLSWPVVIPDETSWRLMSNKKRRNGDPKAKPKRWWVWGVTSPILAFYRLADSRASESAQALLNGYTGKVVADGYGVYDSLSQDPHAFDLIQCWAHVRRGFVESERNHPQLCKEILDLIGGLYRVEAEAPTWDPFAPQHEQQAALRERLRLRQQRSAPLTKQIHQWLLNQLPMHLPESRMGKAVAYAARRWAPLIKFLDDPRVPLDTNAVERALRGVVIGRKNHYGSRSKRGTTVAAVFYTLFESAKLCGVDPKAYVLTAALAALREPGTVTLPMTLRDPR